MKYFNSTVSLRLAITFCVIIGSLFFATDTQAQCNDASACNNGDPNNSCTYPGCTDPSANNYCSGCGCSNGSCTYNCYILGCTDPTACNYNSSACGSDNSCYYPGCQDPSAINYCASNCCGGGTCYYYTYGCTDASACNFDPSANYNNGTCTYPGCEDYSACNYNSSAGCSNSSLCYYPGCTDPGASNYCSSCCSGGYCEYIGTLSVNINGTYNNTGCNGNYNGYVYGTVNVNGQSYCGSPTIDVSCGGCGQPDQYISQGNSFNFGYFQSASFTITATAGAIVTCTGISTTRIITQRTITATDGCDNPGSASASISDASNCGSAISASIVGSSNESCPGSNDGSLTISLSGGDGSNNYYIQLYNSNNGQWYYATSGGSNPYTFSGLPAGTYAYLYVYDNDNTGDGYADYSYPYYSISDNNSVCASPISFSVGSYSNASCPGSYDGSITLDISGGDGTSNYVGQIYDAYNGTWYYAGPTNGGNTLTFTGLYYGNYYYAYIYDYSNNYDGWEDQNSSWYYYLNYNNGSCGSSISISQYSTTNASCPSSSDGSVTLYVTGGDGNTYYVAEAYDASTGQTYYSSPTNSNYVTISGLQYGYYYYYYVYDYNNSGDGWASYDYIYSYPISYNNGSCGSSISAYVSSSSNESCPGSNNGSITLYVSGGDGNNYYYAVAYDYGGTPYTSSNQNGPYVTISGLPAGDYYYIYVYDANNSGDGWADYTYPYYSIGDNSASCGGSISISQYSSTNASCPSSNDGSVTLYVTGGDGNNYYVAQAYDASNGQTYTSGPSNGPYITISGLQYGYYYYYYVYDYYNSGDGWASYDYIYTYPISYNNGSCGSSISISQYSTTNASCPSSSDGSVTLYVTGGDGSNYYVAEAYNSSTGQTYSSGSTYGPYVTINGLPYGYYYYYYVYDANNSGDGWASYDYIYTYPISYNNGSCGSSISISQYSSTNASCPSSSDGSVTLYVTGGDGSTYYVAEAYDASTGQTYYSNPTNSNYVTISGLPYGYYYYYYVYDYNNSGDGWASYDYIYSYPISYNSGTCPTAISGYYSSVTNASCPSSYDGSMTFYASGGDGSNNYQVEVYEYSYNFGTYQWYTASVASNGSNYVTVTGLPYGEVYEAIIYDAAAGTSDTYAGVLNPYQGVGYNSNTCPSDISFTVTNITSASDLCPGTQNGSISINISGGDGNSNYIAVAWLNGSPIYSAPSNGSSTITFNNDLQSGNYTISVYDVNNGSAYSDGWQDVSNTVYTVGAVINGCPIGAQLNTYTSPSTPCDSNGTMNVFVYYGDGTGNYVADAYINGSSTPYETVNVSGSSSGTYMNFNNLPPGNYVIDVYNAASPNGADNMGGSLSYNLQPDINTCLIAATVSATNKTICSDTASGSIKVTVTGGGNHTYNDYAVDLYYSSYANQTIAPTQFTTLNGSVTFYGLPAGSYNISVTDYIGGAEDQDGAQFSDNDIIIAVDTGSLLATVSPVSGVCANSAGNLYVTQGGESNYLWTLTGDASYTGGGSGDSSVTITWGSSGSGDIKVSYIIPATGCKANADQHITINALPTPSISASGSTTLCQGGSVILNAGNYTAYVWQDNSTNEVDTALNAGTYAVTVTDNNGCKGATSIHVSQSTPLAIVADSVDQIGSSCNGVAKVTVSGGTGPYSYDWQTGGQTTDSITGQCAGTYCCHITDNNSCSQTACVTVNLVNGINTISGVANIGIYPEPNNGYFKVEGLEIGQAIELYDYNGQKLSVTVVNNIEMHFDISDKANGIYLIRILSKDGNPVSEKKVVKAL